MKEMFMILFLAVTIFSLVLILNEKFFSAFLQFIGERKYVHNIFMIFFSFLSLSVIFLLIDHLKTLKISIENNYNIIEISPRLGLSASGLSFLILHFSLTKYGSAKLKIIWKKNASRNFTILFFSTAIICGSLGFLMVDYYRSIALDRGYHLCESGIDYIQSRGFHHYAAPGIDCEVRRPD